MPITLNSSFSDIAVAIRELNGKTTTYKPTEMAGAILKWKDPFYPFVLTTAPESVWSSGTDNDVLLMVQLADAGDIDLTDYWSVGDTRSVSLSAMSATGVGESHSAQIVEMVLMHANPDKYTYVTTPSSGRTKPYFIYGQKDCLAATGYMNSSNTNSGSWNSSKRKTWCDAVYRAAVPDFLKTITKQVSFKTGVKSTDNSTNGASNQSCTGYFFLPAEKEIQTSRYYGTNNEASALKKWTYYTTSANRIKKLGTSGDASYWWLRSPSYANSSRFCLVNSSGGAGYTGASNAYGLAPHGCI